MKEVPFQVAVAEIGQSPYYRAIVEKIRSLAPLVPAFKFQGDSNIEEIKFRLAQREMHTLVLSILEGKAA